MTILHLAEAFFRWKEWPLLKSSDVNRIHTIFQGEHGTWRLFALCHPDKPLMVFYSVYPKPCPEQNETALFELLHRANEGLLLGNFEYDFRDKMVRFKTSFDATGQDLNLQMCNPAAYYNLLSMDQYFTPLTACIERGMSPKEALERIGKPESALEKPSKPPPVA